LHIVCANVYKIRSMVAEVTAENVGDPFLRHSVVSHVVDVNMRLH